MKRFILALALALGLAGGARAWDEHSFGASGSADPSAIYFSQDSISSQFQDGSTVQHLITNLANGTTSPSSIPAIRIFWKRDWARWVTLDNRRLYAFKQARRTKHDLQIRYVKTNMQTVQRESFKLTSKNRGASIRVRR
jgi:hypothetical protein